MYAGALSSPTDMTATFRFYNAAGRRLADVPVAVGRTQRSLMQSFAGMRARLLTIEVESPGSADARLAIGDLRVQGQSAALREYVRRHLRFPAP